MILAAAIIELVTLHMIDGRVVQINPRQVTQIISPLDGNKTLPDAVHCVVRLSDGSFTSVAEDCDKVRRLMQKEH